LVAVVACLRANLVAPTLTGSVASTTSSLALSSASSQAFRNDLAWLSVLLRECRHEFRSIAGDNYSDDKSAMAQLARDQMQQLAECDEAQLQVLFIFLN
jgi:hypothetical protein